MDSDITEVFGIGDACRLSGATKRQLDWWDRNGLIEPLFRAQGYGSRRKWTFVDVLAASLITATSLHLGDHGGQLCALFADQALPLALHLHHEVYGDWDAVLLVSDAGAAMAPSWESAMAIISVPGPNRAFSVLGVAPFAAAIQEVLGGQASIR